MDIAIESVVSLEDTDAMFLIREQVFEREMGIPLSRLAAVDDRASFHLLARVGPDGDAVAALSLVDTSGDHELHRVYGLRFHAGARAARYTQLAVLKPYRGMNIPLMLILEAHRQFVAKGAFDYTWLLFDAQRAARSLMCKWLAFAPGDHTFASEYGLSRTLSRDERAPQAEQAIWRTEQYVEQTLKAFCAPGQLLASPVSIA